MADHWVSYTSNTTGAQYSTGGVTYVATTYPAAWSSSSLELTPAPAPAPARKKTALDWLDDQVEAVCAKGRLAA